MSDLFPKEMVIGAFRGFSQGGLEFHADLAIPYRPDLHSVPMHGQFVVVQLENPDEGVLGRITSLSADGRLSSSVGEDYNIRAIREDRPISEQLRSDYLKYRVGIRVLGLLHVRDDEPAFVPSHRRLPHVGSPVAFLDPKILQTLVGHRGAGADIGVFALGEYVYGRGSDLIEAEDWMQIEDPEIVVRFPIMNLVSRRTFVFARAGFGKSNLNKLLFSKLYEKTPTVSKRGGREVPVGTLIFDPEGEYFWPDDSGRPGLCDCPQLSDQIVVFTPREAPSPFYGSFVAGGIKLDVRRLRPRDVISIALPPEKQDQQNVGKLRSLNSGAWAELVDLIYAQGRGADLDEIQRILNLERDQQKAEALAARSNMALVVGGLHDPSSQLMDKLLAALSDGKLCIVDVSQMRGNAALILSGLILRRIFDRNQEEFTRAEPRTIPTIAVVEEAQSVLNEKASAAGPYIEWVKEGRKYDLGAMLITQQPGSIPKEILSQGDNWFVFHLLSEDDLGRVRSANAHFSRDLLSTLLNEPIKGQGLCWSSEGTAQFPVSLRVASFESQYSRLDKSYSRDAVECYAGTLRDRFDSNRSVLAPSIREKAEANVPDASDDAAGFRLTGSPPDHFRSHQDTAIDTLRNDPSFWASIDAGGIPYGKVVGILKDALPEDLDGRGDLAFNLVPAALDEVFDGEQEVAWATEIRTTRSGKPTRFVVRVRS